MKKLMFLFIAFVLATTVWSSAADQQAETFKGEVSDSQCAMNVHSLTRSHKEMLKGKSMGTTAAECSTYCIQNLGGRLVLAATKDVRYLDRPDLVTPYLGKKVMVRGTLDRSTNLIHVLDIKSEEK